MIPRSVMLALGLAVGATAAMADCREELAAMGGGLSKDGSAAPMAGTAPPTPQTGADAAAAPDAAEHEGEGMAKDGSAAPLGADPGVATSPADVGAQQAGGSTAAEQAAGAEGGGDMKAQAMARAEAALAAGDEAGCMEALEEAKG